MRRSHRSVGPVMIAAAADARGAVPPGGSSGAHRSTFRPVGSPCPEGIMPVLEPKDIDWEIAKVAQRDCLLVRHVPSGRVFQINMLAALAEAGPRSPTLLESQYDRLRAATLRLAARRLPKRKVIGGARVRLTHDEPTCLDAALARRIRAL
jgi:hypothetical protein